MSLTIEIQNLKCGGCANTITKSLSSDFDGVTVDVEKKTVTVESGDEAGVKARLRSLGYPAVGEAAGAVEGTLLKAKSFVSCATGKFDLK